MISRTAFLNLILSWLSDGTLLRETVSLYYSTSIVTVRDLSETFVSHKSFLFMNLCIYTEPFAYLTAMTVFWADMPLPTAPDVLDEHIVGTKA